MFIAVFAGLMLFGMHYFQYNLGGRALSLPFNLVVWCFVSVLIAIGLYRVSDRQQLVYNRDLILLTVAVILLWLPMLYPDNQLAGFALGRMLGLTAGLLLVFALQQMQLSRGQWQQILYWVVIAVIIESLFGLTQYYLLTENNWVGYNVNGGRPFAIFQQRNVASTFLLFGPLAAAWLIQQRALLRRRQEILVACVCIIAPWLIVLNASLTAQISLLASIVLIAPLLYRDANAHHFRLWLFAILFGIAIPFFLSAFHQAEPFVRTDFTASNQARLTMLNVCWKLFTLKPWLGWGYGGFEVTYHHGQALFAEQGLNYGLYSPAGHPHNELALWAVEGGLLPIITIIGFAGYCLKRLFSQGWRMGCFSLGLLFPPLFHSMTEFPFYYSAVIWALFMLFWGRISTQSESTQVRYFPASFAPRVFAFLLPVLTIVFMLSGLFTIAQITKFETNGFRDTQLLTSIVNPFPMNTRWETDLMRARFAAGIQGGLPQEVEAYRRWAEQQIQRQSSPEVYRNLILALETLKLPEKAKSRYQEARWLFPDNRLFKEMPKLQNFSE